MVNWIMNGLKSENFNSCLVEIHFRGDIENFISEIHRRYNYSGYNGADFIVILSAVKDTYFHISHPFLKSTG